MTPIRYCIVSGDASFARTLGWALRAEALRQRFTKRETVRLRGAAKADADVLIYAFDAAQIGNALFAERQQMAIQGDGAATKVFLQLAAGARDEIDRKNRIIAAMAATCGAHAVLTADLMQTGVRRRLKNDGTPNLYGYLSIAHAILNAVKAQSLRRAVQTQGRDSAQPSADEGMAQLAWRQPHLPASLPATYRWESIEDFLNGQVSFASHRSWGKTPLGEPIDWSAAGANLSWQSYFTGLDFLRPVLAFWFDQAHGRARRSDPDIAERLLARGTTPGDCLKRASLIVADFVRRNPSDAPANPRAFAEGTVSRRVRVLLLYLLCCKTAEEKGTPVDRAQRDLAWRGLMDALAMLQSDEIYPKANNHGVRQDGLFLLIGLLFPKLDYAQRLSRLGLERLERHQLGRALSSDGVWLENSFGYHCLVMNQLSALAADLREASAAASAPIHDVLRRMWPFAEALIKPDGTAPLIGDTTPRYLFPTLAEVHREIDPAPLALETFARSKNMYYFPDAGYFASHTARTMNENSSSVIFFASLSTPKHKQSDDLSLIFSRGAHDLLVDGGTYSKEVSDTVRNAARFDPASHNTFRVNGGGYALRAIKSMRPAGLDGEWQGDGWAAAQGHNNAYEDARIVRTVIHLKRHHAVIVVDKLSSKTSSEALFEQFWHLSPDLTQAADGAWTSDQGSLLVAFDGGADVTVEHGGPDNPIAWLMLSEDKTVPTPYLRRALRTKDGVMVSLFQSTETIGAATVAITPSRNKIEIAAKGVGFACRFLAATGTVECKSLDRLL